MANFPRFPQLPNEIKLQIIETSDPEDLENLVLCCKLVYSFAKKTLVQHRIYKFDWSLLSFSLARNDKSECFLLHFLQLRDIATNKRLRRYPKCIKIHGCSGFSFPSPFARVEIQDEVKLACDTMSKNFKSPYFDDEEIYTLFNKLPNAEAYPPYVDRTSAIANSILLTLLPNVERIKIYNHQTSPEIAFMIRKISKTNRNAPSFMRSQLSLINLSEVKIHSDYGHNNRRYNTGILEAFLALPTLLILRLSNLGPRYTIKTPMSAPYSNLTEIHCKHCSLNTTQLRRLFDYVICLRVFSYDHTSYEINSRFRDKFSPSALLHVVHQRAKSSLTYLNCSTNARPRRGLIGPVGSFRGYEKLKIMRLSPSLLLQDGKEVIGKKLVDELPASLEELELCDVLKPAEAQSLFAGMLETKRERLPKLRYVVFEEKIPFDDRTVDLFELMGVTMDWRMTGPSEDSYSRNGMLHKLHRRWLGDVKCNRYY